MAYVVRLRKGDVKGPIFGTLGPFPTQELAHEQAQIMADQSAANIVVTIEPHRKPAKRKKKVAIAAPKANRKRNPLVRTKKNPLARTKKNPISKKAVFPQSLKTQADALFARAKKFLSPSQYTAEHHRYLEALRNLKLPGGDPSHDLDQVRKSLKAISSLLYDLDPDYTSSKLFKSTHELTSSLYARVGELQRLSEPYTEDEYAVAKDFILGDANASLADVHRLGLDGAALHIAELARKHDFWGQSSLTWVHPEAAKVILRKLCRQRGVSCTKKKTKKNPGVGAALKLAKSAGSKVAKKAAPHAKAAAKRAALGALDMARDALKANPKKKKAPKKNGVSDLEKRFIDMNQAISAKLSPAQLEQWHDGPFLFREITFDALRDVDAGYSKAEAVQRAKAKLKSNPKRGSR